MLRRALSMIALVGGCGRIGFGESNPTSDAIVLGDAAAPFVEPAGKLDPTFGTGGFTTLVDASRDLDLHGVVSRPGGYLAIGIDGNQLASRFGLFGFTLEGALDPAFGTAGKIDLGPTPSDYAYGLARIDPSHVAITGDGDDGSTTSDDLTTTIVDLSGAPDPMFGTAGFVRWDSGAKPDTSNAVATDGSSLVVCGATDYKAVDSHFVLERLDRSGNRVASWGTGGIVLDDFQPTVQDECIDVVMRPDGGVYAAGRSGTGLVIAAYDATGHRDPGFGGNGYVLLVTGTSAYAYGIALVGTDVIAVGESNGNSILVRVGADGTPIAGFGASGIATLPNIDLLSDVLAQPNGKLLVSGLFADRAIVARVLANGTLDPDFASNGVFSLAIDPGTQFAGILLDPAAGEIVAVGTTNATSPLTGVIARLR